MRASLLFAGSALSVGLLNPAGAWAQCTSTLPTISIPGDRRSLDASAFIPLARGSSVNSILSVLNTASTAFLTNTSAFVSAPAGPQPDQQGGGVWGRTIGGSVETKNGFATPGSVNCTTTTRQDYAGFQVGHDISILNHGASGANWHFGVTAGYFESFARDTTTGGTFTGNFQVPFAGLYTAFTQGNLFLDGQAGWDFYQNNISDSANGIFNQDFNARGFSSRAMPATASICTPTGSSKPSAGVVWSKVSVDPLNVSGTRAGNWPCAARNGADRRHRQRARAREPACWNQFHVRQRALAAVFHRQRVSRICGRCDHQIHHLL
jgi:hypothetical protein